MMSSNSSTMAATRHAMNLKTLKRHDPSCTDLVDWTSYVCLYRYGSSTGGADGEEMSWVGINNLKASGMRCNTGSVTALPGQDWDRRDDVPLQAVRREQAIQRQDA